MYSLSSLYLPSTNIEENEAAAERAEDEETKQEGKGAFRDCGGSMEVVAPVHGSEREGEAFVEQDAQDQTPEEKEESSGAEAAGCFYSHFFSLGQTVPKIPDNVLLSARRISTATSASISLPPSQVVTQKTKSSIVQEKELGCDFAHFNGVGRGYLTALADVWLSGIIRGEAETK